MLPGPHLLISHEGSLAFSENGVGKQPSGSPFDPDRAYFPQILSIPAMGICFPWLPSRLRLALLFLNSI